MLLAQEPQLLLVDEPVAGMTDSETEQTAILLREINRTRSVVVVEHDMAFVRALGVKVTVLHEGLRAERREHRPRERGSRAWWRSILVADSLDLHGWNAPIILANGGQGRRRGVAMGVVVILTCWICTVLYFFGRKIVALYDVLVSLLTHFIPLGPIVLIALTVALIVLACPKRRMLD